jgi:hypothetical protein
MPLILKTAFLYVLLCTAVCYGGIEGPKLQLPTQESEQHMIYKKLINDELLTSDNKKFINDFLKNHFDFKFIADIQTNNKSTLKEIQETIEFIETAQYQHNTNDRLSNYIPGLRDFFEKINTKINTNIENYDQKFTDHRDILIQMDYLIRLESAELYAQILKNHQYPGKEKSERAINQATDLADQIVGLLKYGFKKEMDYFGTELNRMMNILGAMGVDPSDREKKRTLARFIKDKSKILDCLLDIENDKSNPVMRNMSEVYEKRKTVLEYFKAIRAAK